MLFTLKEEWEEVGMYQRIIHLETLSNTLTTVIGIKWLLFSDSI